MKTRSWRGHWICSSEVYLRPTESAGAAPCLRKEFSCPEKFRKAIMYLCGLGWHELYINGRKADDRVLAPNLSQYDKLVSYIAYDVTALLHPGANAVAVYLGNGLYNCFEIAHWNFDKAPWRDLPKLCCDLELDGNIILSSDDTWKCHASPIIFDAMRNGEFYDARNELDGVAEASFDDSAWANAQYCYPPGGILFEEEQEPCRVTRTYEPIEVWQVDSNRKVYDFGTNLTGWVRIKVKGRAGTVLEFEYGEKTDPVSHQLESGYLAMYIDRGRFQTDRYILRGRENGEEWEPAFTYHGFRYVMVGCYNGEAEIESIQACFVHTDFAQLGKLDSSAAMLNKLQQITCQSYLANFTSIPTDCPHREKNGWTGDANWAAETGFWNFDVRKSCKHFLNVLTSCQRPNGQLPGIAPTPGYGYNWGNGPSYDGLLFEYIYNLYLFANDNEAVHCHYDAMRRYLDYCRSMSSDHLVSFGLDDWCPVDRINRTPLEVTASGYYYQCLQRMAFFAGLLKRPQDQDFYANEAAGVKKAFADKFIRNDGSVANNSWTSLGTVLYFGLADENLCKKIAGRLVAEVRNNAHKVNFGTNGAKFIPRVLADYGYAEDAYLLITQDEFPGWGWWVRQGATTLWEQWNGTGSRTHIMFGDISAWMYQYLGGVSPLPEAPGFKHTRIRPNFVPQLEHFCMSYLSPYGRIISGWRRSGKDINYSITLPENCSADLYLPDGCRQISGGVTLDLTVKM